MGLDEMLKPLTTDYEHFADPKTGIMPWLAGIVRVLIKNQDDEALQQLVNDIAQVANSMYDLNDEVLDVRQRYQQLKNKREAVLRDLEQKQAAVGAIDKEMEEAFGVSDIEANPLDDLIGLNAEKIDLTNMPVDLSAEAPGMTPEPDEMTIQLLDMAGDVTGLSREDVEQRVRAAGILLGASDAQVVIAIDEALSPSPSTPKAGGMTDAIAQAKAITAQPDEPLDPAAASALDVLENISIEEMIGPSEEDLRAMGLEFADDEDWGAEDPMDEEIDDEVYDNFDIGDEDTDDGYKPLAEVGIDVDGDAGGGGAYGDADDDADGMDASFDMSMFGDDADLIADVFGEELSDGFGEDEIGLPTFALPDDEEEGGAGDDDGMFDDMGQGSGIGEAEEIGSDLYDDDGADMYDTDESIEQDNVDAIFENPSAGMASAPTSSESDDDDIPDAGFVDVTQL